MSDTARGPAPSLEPPATIGVLGGGQLGRMFALAARRLGFRIVALDPDPRCAAHAVVDRLIVARFDDVEAGVALADACDVVTYEIEKIDAAVLAAVEARAPLRASSRVLHTIQDRRRQKAWLASIGAPLGAYEAVEEEDVAEAVRRLGGPCFVKAARDGYDGRGQVWVPDAAAVADTLRGRSLGPCVVERALPLEAELSVLVARRPSGEVVTHPPALNVHDDGILVRSVIPAPLAPEIRARAEEIARTIAAAIGLEGVLVVEQFWSNGALTVNELAPRPHNSYHHAEAACATGQYEQLARAVADLPLGAPDVVRPAALVNLLGDVFLGDSPLRLADLLAARDVKVELYGKEPKPKRKVGHAVVCADTPERALARAEALEAEITRRR